MCTLIFHFISPYYLVLLTLLFNSIGKADSFDIPQFSEGSLGNCT